MSRDHEEDTRQVVLDRLMRKTARGDWQSFSLLYAMTSSQLFGLILRMTNYAHAGEDLLQEVYLAVWRRAEQYDPEKGKVMTWLRAVTRNRTLDWLRSRAIGMEKHMTDQSPEAIDLATGGEEPEEHAQSVARQTALSACLDALVPNQRQAIVLAFIEGHSHAELAERMNSPLGTVKSWVRRGLDQLKSCLQGTGGRP